MVNKFYVYAHYKPKSSIPFYIGKGCGNRAMDTKRRNVFWNRVVSKYGFRYKILECNLEEMFAFDLEANYIACYGRRDLGLGPLVNLTSGYDGLFEISPETRKLWSKQRSGIVPWNKNIPWSEESKRKMSNAAKGRRGYWTGKKRTVSDIARQHLSDSLKKAYSEGRRKSNIGIKMSKESSRKKKEAMNRYWATRKAKVS
jgi:hypothetical protein